MILATLWALFQLVTLIRKLVSIFIIWHAFTLVQIFTRDCVISEVETVATVAGIRANFIATKLITDLDRVWLTLDMPLFVLFISSTLTLVQIVITSGPSKTSIFCIGRFSLLDSKQQILDQFLCNRRKNFRQYCGRHPLYRGHCHTRQCRDMSSQEWHNQLDTRNDNHRHRLRRKLI